MSVRFIYIVAVLIVGIHSPAFGQQVRYMDSSGNINFVDNVSQVPPRYRQQVETPTPVPVLDRKGMAQKRRQEQLAKQEKAVKEKEKRREERERKYEEQRRKKEEAKKNRNKARATGFGRLQ